jgi:hypothetical protein
MNDVMIKELTDRMHSTKNYDGLFTRTIPLHIFQTHIWKRHLLSTHTSPYSPFLEDKNFKSSFKLAYIEVGIHFDPSPFLCKLQKRITVRRTTNSLKPPNEKRTNGKEKNVNEVVQHMFHYSIIDI